MMHVKLLKMLDNLFPATIEKKPWEWADENINYNLASHYPTAYKGRYDSDLLPFWREPVENCFDPQIREQAILKPSQAGGTENIALNAIRFSVAQEPRRILYVWGDQKSAEEDFKGRIVAGLECSELTRARLKQARNVECRLDFTDMTIAGAWPKNKQAFKRNPWSMIIADEFSTYPDLTPTMMRKRCDTVPFSHIVWLSSPDPQMKRSSDEDPIFVEFAAGDQRHWMMPDPETGNLFKFEMGSDEVLFGLKWPKECKRPDGSWDLDMVRAQAYYVTPDGTRINNADRMRIVRSGKWVPTNLNAPKTRRSYHINAFYMPFRSGDFGEIAAAFLQAVKGGPGQLKVFVYEYLAERFYETLETAEEEEISKRVEIYKRGQRLTNLAPWKEIYIAKQKAVIMEVDVQKDHFWYAVREFIDGGDSSLLTWSHCVGFDDLSMLAEELSVEWMGIDYGYQFREYEVLQYALEMAAVGSQWVIPLKGNDNMSCSLMFSYRDPFLGKARGGINSVETYSWHTDIFRSLLVQQIQGKSKEKWRVYENIEADYCKQVTSMEKRDGVWMNRKGHSQDHLFDCECMGLVVARIFGYFQNRFLDVGK